MQSLRQCSSPVNLPKQSLSKRNVYAALRLGFSALTLVLGLQGCTAASMQGLTEAANYLPINSSNISNLINGDSSPTSPSPNRKSPTQTEIVGIDSAVPKLLKTMGAGDRIDISTALSDETDGYDTTLAHAELGRIAQLQGETDVSLKHFEDVLDDIDDIDERAIISISDWAAHAAALVVNDNLIPYAPPAFERVLAYHYQALNYLMRGNLEDAAVEVRRANAAQVRALKDHEDELADAEEEAKKQEIKTSQFSKKIDSMLGSSKAVAAQVKNSFQNAYTFYMSAVVHELMKEPNDAYIDYKKALEIAPTNVVIQRDVARLAKSLEMTDDSSDFSKRFPVVFKTARNLEGDQSEVIVLFEDGIIPGKTAVAFPLPIPIPNAPGLTKIAIPIYKASVAPVSGLSVSQGGKSLGKTERICAMDALAVKAYEESAVAMIIRQIVRASLKGAASALASKHGGTLAGVAVATYNVLSEVADTRSWRSLPQNAQVLRARVSPGGRLDFVHGASGAKGSVLMPTEAGKKMIVRATRIGSRLFIQSVSF